MLHYNEWLEQIKIFIFIFFDARIFLPLQYEDHGAQDQKNTLIMFFHDWYWQNIWEEYLFFHE